MKTLLGSEILRKGPPYKYIFGTRHFSTTQWNRQIDGFFEDYWRRFDRRTLRDHVPEEDDYVTILKRLQVKSKVTFWTVVGDVRLRASTWKQREFKEVTGQELKKQIRSPIKSSRDRVLAEYDSVPQEEDPVPDPKFGDLPPPFDDNQGPIVNVDAVLEESVSRVPKEPKFVAGYRFLEEGVYFKYVVGVSEFASHINPWNQRVEELVSSYWQSFSEPELNDAFELTNHLAVFLRLYPEISFWKVHKGSYDSRSHELVSPQNWESLLFVKITDCDELKKELFDLLDSVKSRVKRFSKWPALEIRDRKRVPLETFVDSRTGTGNKKRARRGEECKKKAGRDESTSSPGLMKEDLGTFDGTNSEPKHLDDFPESGSGRLEEEKRTQNGNHRKEENLSEPTTSFNHFSLGGTNSRSISSVSSVARDRSVTMLHDSLLDDFPDAMSFESMSLSHEKGSQMPGRK